MACPIKSKFTDHLGNERTDRTNKTVKTGTDADKYRQGYKLFPSLLISRIRQKLSPLSFDYILFVFLYSNEAIFLLFSPKMIYVNSMNGNFLLN